MDSFKYDPEKGLAMISQEKPNVEATETFEQDEDDEKDIKGDNENVEG
jgi:hypothetical protein